MRADDGFFRYDASELRRVAERFVAEIEPLASAPEASDPDVWTELVLDWLASVASERSRVDAIAARPHLTAELYARFDWAPPRAVVRAGPVSMTHASHPSFAHAHPYTYAYWDGAFTEERLETLLAIACEWGGGGRPAARYGRVMLAASDLAGLDARAKAIVIASDGEEERRRIDEGLRKLRLASWDARPWLAIDVPWRVDLREHAPSAWLLEG